MKTKKLYAIIALLSVFIISAMMSVFAASGDLPQVTITEVTVNGATISEGQTTHTRFERGDGLDVVVHYSTTSDLKQVGVEVEVAGYKYGDIEAKTDIDDIKVEDGAAAIAVTEKLSINLPDDMKQTNYLLTVRVVGKDGSVEKNYNLKIDTVADGIQISNIAFTQNPIQSGRGLEAFVRLKNIGDNDQPNTRVRFSIPELGLVAADDYLDIEAEEYKSSEGLYVRIPECTQSGTYTGVVSVYFDNEHKSVSEQVEVTVLDGELCGKINPDAKLTVTLGTDLQQITKGEGGAVYPITLRNNGFETKTITLDVVGAADWADAKITPSNVLILEPNKDQKAFIYVSAKNSASEGAKVFSFDIKSGTELLHQVSLRADVVEKSSTLSNIASALQYVFIVVVIGLVIVGLVLVVQRMRNRDDEDEDYSNDGSKSYY